MNLFAGPVHRRYLAATLRWVWVLGLLTFAGQGAHAAEHLEACRQTTVNVRPLAPLLAQWQVVEDFVPGFQADALDRFKRFLAEALSEPVEDGTPPRNAGPGVQPAEVRDPLDEVLERVFEVWRERGLEGCRERFGDACGLDRPNDRQDNRVILLTDMIEGRLIAARIEPFLRRELEPFIGVVVADVVAAEAEAKRIVDEARSQFQSYQSNLLRAQTLVQHEPSLPPEVRQALLDALGWTIEDVASLASLVERSVAAVTEVDRRFAELLDAASRIAGDIRTELAELERRGITDAERAEVTRRRIAEATATLSANLEANPSSVEERVREVLAVAEAFASMGLERLDDLLVRLDEATTVDVPDRVELGGRFALALRSLGAPTEPHYVLVYRDDLVEGGGNGGCPDVALGITVAVPLTIDGAGGRVVEVEPRQFADALHHFGVPRALRIDLTDDAIDLQLELDAELRVQEFRLAARVGLRPPELRGVPWFGLVPYDLSLHCDDEGCTVDGQPQGLSPLIRTSVEGWVNVLVDELNEASRDVALWGFTLVRPEVGWRWVDAGASAEPVLTVSSALLLSAAGDWGSVPVRGRLTREGTAWVVLWEVAYLDLASAEVDRLQTAMRAFVGEQLRVAEVAVSSDLFTVRDLRIDPHLEAVTGTLVLPFLDCDEPASTTFTIRSSGIAFDFDLVKEAGDCLRDRATAVVAEQSREFVAAAALGECYAEPVSADPFEVRVTREADECNATLTLLQPPFGLRLQGNLRVIDTDGGDPRLVPRFAAGTTAELCLIADGRTDCDDWADPAEVLRKYMETLGISSSLLELKATSTDQGLRIGLVVKLKFVGDVPVGFLSISSAGMSLVGADSSLITDTIRDAVRGAISERLAALSGVNLGGIGPVEDLRAAVTWPNSRLGVRVSGAIRLHGDLRLRFSFDALGDGSIQIEDGVEAAVELALNRLLGFCGGACAVENVRVLENEGVPTGVEFNAEIDLGFTIPLQGVRITRDGIAMARAVGIPLPGPLPIVPPILLSRPVLNIDLESSRIALTGDLVLVEGTNSLSESVKIASSAVVQFDPVSLRLEGTLIVLSFPIARGEGEFVVDPFRFRAEFAILPPLNAVITQNIFVEVAGDGLTAVTRIVLLGVLEGNGLLMIRTNGAIDVQADLDLLGSSAAFDISFREGFTFERASATMNLSVAGVRLASAGIEILPPSTALQARVLWMGLTVRTPSPRDMTTDRVARAIFDLFAFDRLFEALLTALLDPRNVTIVLFTSWGANGDADVGDGDNYTSPDGREGVEAGNPGEQPYPEYPVCVDGVCCRDGLCGTRVVKRTTEPRGPTDEPVEPDTGETNPGVEQEPLDEGGAEAGDDVKSVFQGAAAVPRFDDRTLVVPVGAESRVLGGPVDQAVADRAADMEFLYYLKLEEAAFLFMWHHDEGVQMVQLAENRGWVHLGGINRNQLGVSSLSPAAFRIFVDAARMRPETFYSVKWLGSDDVLASFDVTQPQEDGYRLLRSVGPISLPHLAYSWLSQEPHSLPVFLNQVRDPRLLMSVAPDSKGQGGRILMVDGASFEPNEPLKVWSWTGQGEGSWWSVTLAPRLGRPNSAEHPLIEDVDELRDFLSLLEGSDAPHFTLVGQPGRFVATGSNTNAAAAAGYLALAVGLPIGQEDHATRFVHVAIVQFAARGWDGVRSVDLASLGTALRNERDTCDIQVIGVDQLLDDAQALSQFLLQDRWEFAANGRAYRDAPSAHVGPPPTCTFPWALLEKAIEASESRP